MHGRSLFPIHVLLNQINEIASQKTMNKTYVKPFDRTFIGLFKKCEPTSYKFQPTNQGAFINYVDKLGEEGV